MYVYLLPVQCACPTRVIHLGRAPHVDKHKLATDDINLRCKLRSGVLIMAGNARHAEEEKLPRVSSSPRRADRSTCSCGLTRWQPCACESIQVASSADWTGSVLGPVGALLSYCLLRWNVARCPLSPLQGPTVWCRTGYIWYTPLWSIQSFTVQYKVSSDETSIDGYSKIEGN